MSPARRTAGLACACVVALAACGGSSAPAPAPVRAAAPARPTSAGAPVFPLAPGPTGRYLVDAAHRPFLITGDSPQALVVNASVAQAAHFLADRRAAGFNTVWVNLLCDKYTGGRPDGSTYDGLRPFRVAGDLATPDAAYFARADAMVRAAQRDRMAVLLDPIETGGWLDVLRRNGVAKAFAYGQYVGRRYRRFPNVVWFNGNDFQTWRNPSDDALVLAVARGIRSVEPARVQTTELNYLVSASLDDRRWAGQIQLDAAYTYKPTYAEVLKEYARPRHLPVFMVEANYEGEHDYTGPQTLRRQEYWSLLSGAAGQLYGNKYTWPLAAGWPSHLDTVGSREMTYVRNLFAPRRWYDLVPDQRHRIVVSGYGDFTTDGSVNDSDYVTAAATPDGRLAIAYLPTGRPVSVDLGRLARPVRARWYDPTRGTFAAVAGAPFRSAGVRRFTPPGRNRGGGPDWVLVLDRP